jgi:hypothetical protein
MASAGGQSVNSRTVAVLVACALALCILIGLAMTKIGTLEESLRAMSVHASNHRLVAMECVEKFQAHKQEQQQDNHSVSSQDTIYSPRMVSPLDNVPHGSVSRSDIIFRRSFPTVDTPIGSCGARVEVECTSSSCIAVMEVPRYTGGAVDRCTSICAAFSNCNYFWLYDDGKCCLKTSYDAEKALDKGGLRPVNNGDYYRLTQRGPPPPLYVPPAVSAGIRTGDKYECSGNSWVGENPTSSKASRPRLVLFKDKDSVPSDTLPSMLEAIQTTDHDGEERRYVDFGEGQHCVTPNKLSLYDIGVLTHFSHALLKMDEIVDCSGQCSVDTVLLVCPRPLKSVEVFERVYSDVPA